MEQQLYKVCYSVTRNGVSGYVRYTWIPCNGDEEQAKELIEQMEEVTERDRVFIYWLCESMNAVQS